MSYYLNVLDYAFLYYLPDRTYRKRIERTYKIIL